MKKITETVEKWIGKKEEVISFDFLNKKEIVKKNHKKNILNVLGMLFFMQLTFFVSNMNNILNIVDNKSNETEQIFHDYGEIQKNMREGHQQESIIAFSNLIQKKQPITDLLAGGFVLSILAQDDNNIKSEEKKLIENNRYKLTPETKNSLVNLYKKTWNDRVIHAKMEKDNVDNYQCIFVDISCYALKNFWKLKKMEFTNVVEKKLNITHYHIEHIEEFKKWQGENLKIINNNMKVEDALKLPINKSPGEIALTNENR